MTSTMASREASTAFLEEEVFELADEKNHSRRGNMFAEEETFERVDIQRSRKNSLFASEESFERPEKRAVTFETFTKFDNGAEKPVRPGLTRQLSYSTRKTISKISLVEQSWNKVSENIGEVGLKCFLRMFDEYPDIVGLFPFSEEFLEPVSGRLKINDRTRMHVRAHSIAVMRVVGACVGGLTSIDDLIPRLRNVGETHKMMGVQPRHYDILYRHMVQAIREEVGPDDWDQETEDAWEQAYISISDLMNRPSTKLETEPLWGWGIVIMAACVYFMIITPFELAGFTHGQLVITRCLNILDGLAALIMFLDLMIYIIQTKLKGYGVSKDTGTTKSSTRTRTLRRTIERFVHHTRQLVVGVLETYQLDRWVPWHALDLKVLLSFPLQWVFSRSFVCDSIGLHWSHLFGLLRVLTASRVMHFLQCAENNALIKQKLNTERQLQLRVAKLLLRLAFMLHFFACMWCTIARVELGSNATEFEASAFFPYPDIISGADQNMARSYSRALHWAFVNLSGIGGANSNPSTSLEVWTTLLVHVVGAYFYAIITGNVIAILEEESKRVDEIGSGIMKLSSYLERARVAEPSKERIMRGYMMRNLLTDENQDHVAERSSSVADIDLGADILNTLPRYLQTEVGIYARAELIRHDKFFAHCSQGFLLALSSSLSGTRTLLTGDYLMRMGTFYDQEFLLVEKGSLQVNEGNNTIKTLNRGECFGKAWLLQFQTHEDGFSERTDWLRANGEAGVTIRALSPCTLLTGLASKRDIENLENGYKPDFQLMRIEARGTARSYSERKAIAVTVIAKVVRKWKERRYLAKQLAAGR